MQVAVAGRGGAQPSTQSLIGRLADRRARVRDLLTGKSLLAYHPGVGDVFKAIADQTRRAILDELHERNGQTLFELCVRLTTKHGLGSSRQAVSQHLDVLEDAGLVITRREGRYKFHYLDTSPLREISERWAGTDEKAARAPIHARSSLGLISSGLAS